MDVSSVNNMYYMFPRAIDFNQWLLSWADKTQPDVNVGSIFCSSGWPNKNAAEKVACWCQGEDDQA